MSDITTEADRFGDPSFKDGKLEFVDFNADLFNARLGLNQTIRQSGSARSSGRRLFGSS